MIVFLLFYIIILIVIIALCKAAGKGDKDKEAIIKSEDEFKENITHKE